MPDLFEEEKRRLWERLWEDLEIGYLDEDILPILIEFFARPKAYTSSSCSGRIVVIDADYPWEKDETMIIFKKHTPITADEIRKVMYTPHQSTLWLSLQGPIYHVYVKDLDEAREVLEIARRAGFKHSGILVLGNPILVELRTGIRIVTPLKDRKSTFINEKDLPRLVELYNRALKEAKQKNRRLLEELRKARPNQLWEKAREKIDAYTR